MQILSSFAVSIGMKSLPVGGIVARRLFRPLLDLGHFDNYLVEEEGGSRVLVIFRGSSPISSPHSLRCSAGGIVVIARDYDPTHPNKKTVVSELEAVAEALPALEITAADVSFLDTKEEFVCDQISERALLALVEATLSSALFSNLGAIGRTSIDLEVKRSLVENRMNVVRVRSRSSAGQRTWSWFSGNAVLDADYWYRKPLPKVFSALVSDYMSCEVHKLNSQVYSSIKTIAAEERVGS